MTLVAPELAATVLERALARGGDLAELYAEARRGLRAVARRRPCRASPGRARAGRVRPRRSGRVELLRLRRRHSRRRTSCGWRSPWRRRCAARPAGRRRSRRRRARTAIRWRFIPRTSRRGARPTCCGRARSAPAPPAPEVARCGSATASRGGCVEVYNSDGRAAADDRTRIRLSVQVVARRDDRVETGTDTRGGHAGFELLEDDPEQVADERRAPGAHAARRRRRAERAAAGRGGQRLRRRAPARGRRPRPRGGRGPEGRERLRGQDRRPARRAVRDRLRRRRAARTSGAATASTTRARRRSAPRSSRTAGSPPTCTTCCARGTTASSRPATAAASRSATCRSRA